MAGFEPDHPALKNAVYIKLLEFDSLQLIIGLLKPKPSLTPDGYARTIPRIISVISYETLQISIVGRAVGTDEQNLRELLATVNLASNQPYGRRNNYALAVAQKSAGRYPKKYFTQSIKIQRFISLQSWMTRYSRVIKVARYPTYIHHEGCRAVAGKRKWMGWNDSFPTGTDSSLQSLNNWQHNREALSIAANPEAVHADDELIETCVIIIVDLAS
ncbi:hypothetical protein AHF37_05523 [Paragonimus kellicotti]|nr:hypothetical protein AHF37_05523 [Paragonimus kellicotti]